MTIWQIALAVFLAISALTMFGMAIPAIVQGIVATVAAIAVLAGK